MATANGENPTATKPAAAADAPAASTPPDVVLDQAAKDLLLDQKKAEARKAIAEARKAELTALLPDFKVDLPEEKLDAGDSASPIAVIVAYAELDDASSRIVERIRSDLGEESVSGARFLLVRSLDLESDHGAYVAFKSYLSQLTSGVDAALKRLDRTKGPATFGAIPIGPIIGLALNALPTVMSVFQRNRSIRSRDIKVSPMAVAAALSEQLRGVGAEVVVDGFAPIPENNQIFTDVAALRDERDRLAELQARWRLEVVDPKTIEFTSQSARRDLLFTKVAEMLASTPTLSTTEVEKELEHVQELLADLEAKIAEAKVNVDIAQRLIDAVDVFVTASHTASKNGPAPIVTAAALHEFFGANEERYVLLTEAVFAGGESLYDERKVRGDRAEHTGGVTLSYLMTDRSGLIRSGGIVSRAGRVFQNVGADTFEPKPSLRF